RRPIDKPHAPGEDQRQGQIDHRVVPPRQRRQHETNHTQNSARESSFPGHGWAKCVGFAEGCKWENGGIRRPKSKNRSPKSTSDDSRLKFTSHPRQKERLFGIRASDFGFSSHGFKIIFPASALVFLIVLSSWSRCASAA